MKSLIVKTTASLILTLLVFSSCEKRVFDYRNKYCGEWEFSYTMTPILGAEISETHEGSIFYEKKSGRDLLKIDFKQDASITVNCNKSGNLTICGGSGSFIDKENLSFEYTPYLCDTNTISVGYLAVSTLTVTAKKK